MKQQFSITFNFEGNDFPAEVTKIIIDHNVQFHILQKKEYIINRFGPNRVMYFVHDKTIGHRTPDDSYDSTFMKNLASALQEYIDEHDTGPEGEPYGFVPGTSK